MNEGPLGVHEEVYLPMDEGPLGVHEEVYLPVNEGPLGVHEVELVVQPRPRLGDGCRVGQHADCARHLRIHRFSRNITEINSRY